jgi:hypothetical protein
VFDLGCVHLLDWGLHRLCERFQHGVISTVWEHSVAGKWQVAVFYTGVLEDEKDRRREIRGLRLSHGWSDPEMD